MLKALKNLLKGSIITSKTKEDWIMADIKELTTYDIEVLDLIKDLKEFKDGCFEHATLDEKVQAFIEGNQGSSDFDEESFVNSILELSERKCIKTANRGGTRLEVLDITLQGLEIIDQVYGGRKPEERENVEIVIINNTTINVKSIKNKALSLLCNNKAKVDNPKVGINPSVI